MKRDPIVRPSTDWRNLVGIFMLPFVYDIEQDCSRVSFCCADDSNTSSTRQWIVLRYNFLMIGFP